MSNILKSTKLDIALVKPYFKTICFTLLLPIVFAAINRSLLTGVSFAMCFIAMTTGYTFSITEKNSMDRLFGILPVRKSELVIGRYVFVLAMGLLSLIISLIAQPLVLKVLGETVGVFDIVTAAIAGVFLFALYTVFQIPGYYKYGSIKGRVFMYIPVAGFLVTLLLLSKMPAIGNSIISVVESSPILLVLLAVFAIVVMYAVSIFLSIRVMSGIVYAAERKEIAVSVDCPEDLTVSHDSKWTSEALFNLLDNAVKYTPAGGKIAVSVVLWEMYVEIKVADTGKGISESNQAAIFRRFYREEEVHEQQGVGIGLYLAREIVTRQGGYIKVVSEPGKGSEFSIMLPTK